MAVPETDLARVKQWADDHVPAHVRDKLWIEVVADERSVTIFECHAPAPPFAVSRQSSGVAVARLRYVATRKEWELYWCDSNSRFHRYDLAPPAPRVETLLRLIDEDPDFLFWG